MRELSLFSGAGGGLYGSKLLDWKTIGYVEFNEYCQKVIAQRIEDGIFDKAPIFTDVREFVQSGAARSYRGFIDVVTGGFPCQPHSITGKMLGGKDERDMWPETCEVVKTVQPGSCLFENVPGLISTGYIIRVIRDLERIGYKVAPPLYLTASQVGAEHVRDRCWIYAANTNSPQFKRGGISKRIQAEHADFSYSRWRKDQPRVDRAANGLAFQGDRLKAIGNGQFPLNMAIAYEILSCEFAREIGQ